VANGTEVGILLGISQQLATSPFFDPTAPVVNTAQAVDVSLHDGMSPVSPIVTKGTAKRVFLDIKTTAVMFNVTYHSMV
jgi:hypothetical protein